MLVGFTLVHAVAIPGLSVGESSNKRANVKNEKQYETLKDKGMSRERAARIANSPGASSRGADVKHLACARTRV